MERMAGTGLIKSWFSSNSPQNLLLVGIGIYAITGRYPSSTMRKRSYKFRSPDPFLYFRPYQAGKTAYCAYLGYLG